MLDKKIRYPYLDVAKGLLILGVVLTHMLLHLSSKLPNDTFAKVMSAIDHNTWVLFYIPAFFVITGRCSSFNKDFRTYLIDNIISLKVPVFFFIGVLGALSIRPLFGFSPFSPYWWFVRLFDSGVWFIHALFVSKMLYWGISKIPRKWGWQLLPCLFLYAIGTFYLDAKASYFCWLPHAASLLIFLCIGDKLKSKEITKRQGILCGVLFLFTVLLLNTLGYGIPHIVQEPIINDYLDSFLILLLSITGSFAFLTFCKLIGKNKTLQYIGKYSLVIYILHGPEFIGYIVETIPFINIHNSFIVAFDFMLRFVAVISIIMVFAFIIDRPYMRILIGKKI